MQSRRWSLIEAVINVLVGLGISLATQLILFSHYGIEVALITQMKMVGVFTVISIARSYMLRRMFNKIRPKI